MTLSEAERGCDRGRGVSHRPAEPVPAGREGHLGLRLLPEVCARQAVGFAGGRERTGPRFHLGAYPDAVAVGIPMCIPGVRPKNETSARVSGIRGHRANRSVREPGGRSLHEEWQEAQGPQLARPRGRFRGRLRGTGGWGGADPASSPLTRIGTCGTCAAGLSRGAGAREERACAPLCLDR